MNTCSYLNVWPAAESNARIFAGSTAYTVCRERRQLWVTQTMQRTCGTRSADWACVFFGRHGVYPVRVQPRRYHRPNHVNVFHAKLRGAPRALLIKWLAGDAVRVRWQWRVKRDVAESNAPSRDGADPRATEETSPWCWSRGNDPERWKNRWSCYRWKSEGAFTMLQRDI